MEMSVLQRYVRTVSGIADFPIRLNPNSEVEISHVAPFNPTSEIEGNHVAPFYR